MINTVAQLRTSLDTGNVVGITKARRTGVVTGTLHSRWPDAGSPLAGVIPVAAVTCDRNTVGGIPLPTFLPAERKYIGEVEIINETLVVPQPCFFFDRLSHMGGLNGTLATAQTVNLTIVDAAAQGRCRADGLDVFWSFQTYVGIGTTAVTATVTYTNQAGIAGRTVAVSVAGNSSIGRVVPIIPAAGDLGIRSIETVQLSATTGTAGNFGVVARRLNCAFAGDHRGLYTRVADYGLLGTPPLMGNECLEMLSGIFIGTVAIRLAGYIKFISV